MTILLDLLFYAMFGLPVLAAIAFFVVSLVLFVKTPKDAPKRKTRKVLFIVSAVLMGVIIAAIVGFAIIFTMALMHM